MLLYTLGDSFTYGEELEDPATQAWPALLANRLGYTIKNRGRPGCGNSYIVKTAIKEVPQLQPNLVIVAWTSCGRIEFADADGVYDVWPNRNKRVNHMYPHRNELVKYVTVYNNERHQYNSWLRSIVLLQDFFKLRNINYRFVSAFDNQRLAYKYIEPAKVYADLIDVDKFIGWPYEGMVEWVEGTPKCPLGHPSAIGHEIIAEKIFNSLSQ